MIEVSKDNLLSFSLFLLKKCKSLDAAVAQALAFSLNWPEGSSQRLYWIEVSKTLSEGV